MNAHGHVSQNGCLPEKEGNRPEIDGSCQQGDSGNSNETMQYADSCMDFGPAGDPAFLVVDEATVTPVSPFFDANSGCFGLNPGMMFSSDGGGATIELVDLFMGPVEVGSEWVAETVDSLQKDGHTATALAVLISAPVSAAAVGTGKFYGGLLVSESQGTAASGTSLTLSSATKDAIKATAAATAEENESNTSGGTDTTSSTTDSDSGCNPEVQSCPGTEAEPKEGCDSATQSCPEETSTATGGSGYDLEDSMAICGEELSASFGECVPSASSGSGATDYAASVVSDAEGTDFPKTPKPRVIKNL